MKAKDQGEQRNEKLPSFTFASNLRLTLKAWPVIAAATIGLCYLTQTVAKWFGVELPDQANIEMVKKYLGFNRVFLILCAQVLVLMPAAEELIFRGLLFKLPRKLFDARRETGDSGEGRETSDARPGAWTTSIAIASSALFSAAHYIAQPWPDAAFLALFFFGLAQCWLYRKTDRIWCAMLNHALFNLTNLVLLFVLPEA